MTIGPSHEPRNLIERAADAAFAAAAAELEHADAKLTTAFVALTGEGLPEGELDCVVAGLGYEDGRALVVDLAGHLVAAGQQIGIKIMLAPIAVAGDS